MTARGPSEALPSPRAHLAATLRLVDTLATQAGGWSAWPGGQIVREVLDRPLHLPASVRPDMNGLKYDSYITQGPSGPAWGVTFNDRWQGRAIWPVLDALARDLPGDYDVDRVQRLRRAVPGTSVNVALGFDTPGRPPRLKVYLQEADWRQGVLTVGAFAGLSPDLRGGCVLPGVLAPERALGVLTVVLRPDGSSGLKAYVGGQSARAVAEVLRGGCPEVDALAAGMAAACPSSPAWHYLTIRLEEGQEPRYALNRIWEHVRVGFGGPTALEEAWSEVGALFEVAGRGASFDALRSLRSELGALRLVPTAAAYEAGGTSADVYLAAWPA